MKNVGLFKNKRQGEEQFSIQGKIPTLAGLVLTAWSSKALRQRYITERTAPH